MFNKNSLCEHIYYINMRLYLNTLNRIWVICVYRGYMWDKYVLWATVNDMAAPYGGSQDGKKNITPHYGCDTPRPVRGSLERFLLVMSSARDNVWMLLTATRLGPLPEEGGRDSSTECTRLSGQGNIFVITPVSQWLLAARLSLTSTTSPTAMLREGCCHLRLRVSCWRCPFLQRTQNWSAKYCTLLYLRGPYESRLLSVKVSRAQHWASHEVWAI